MLNIPMFGAKLDGGPQKIWAGFMDALELRSNPARTDKRESASLVARELMPQALDAMGEDARLTADQVKARLNPAYPTADAVRQALGARKITQAYHDQQLD